MIISKFLIYIRIQQSNIIIHFSPSDVAHGEVKMDHLIMEKHLRKKN